MLICFSCVTLIAVSKKEPDEVVIDPEEVIVEPENDMYLWGIASVLYCACCVAGISMV